MKKSATKTMILVMIAVVSVLMVAQIVWAATPIDGSKHDLASGTGHDAEICIYCHTPHASQTNPAAPLWNRAYLPTSGFTLYTGPGSLNATLGQPGGVSSTCLSCHDGTVGVDAFGANAGTIARKIANTSAAYIGQDLTNDHPISFTYDAALATADGGLVSPASASLVVAGIPLFTAKLECASCHSVHDNTNAPFLRVSNAGSALCLSCHVK